jgi:hypothetical protein
MTHIKSGGMRKLRLGKGQERKTSWMVTRTLLIFTLWKKRRKKQIVALEGPYGDVHDTLGIIQISVQCYKSLFNSEGVLDINLDDEFWNQ